jgi:hypothetical protein
MVFFILYLLLVIFLLLTSPFFGVAFLVIGFVAYLMMRGTSKEMEAEGQVCLDMGLHDEDYYPARFSVVAPNLSTFDFFSKFPRQANGRAKRGNIDGWEIILFNHFELHFEFEHGVNTEKSEGRTLDLLHSKTSDIPSQSCEEWQSTLTQLRENIERLRLQVVRDGWGLESKQGWLLLYPQSPRQIGPKGLDHHVRTAVQLAKVISCTPPQSTVTLSPPTA